MDTWERVLQVFVPDRTTRLQVHNETRQQLFLIITGALLLATSLAFNSMMLSIVGLVSPEHKVPANIVYFLGMVVLTVSLSVWLKLHWQM